MNPGLLVVISGPTGVGKGTIVRRITEADPAVSLSVSCTTRSPRAGERDGVNYFFVTEEKFLSMMREGALLEYSRHFGNYYGTPRAFVEEKLRSGDVMLEIEVDGAMQVKKSYPGALLIMITPPDTETLVGRIRGRDNEREFDMAARLGRMEYELSKAGEYDYTVVNDRLDDAVSEVTEIIKKEKEKRNI